MIVEKLQSELDRKIRKTTITVEKNRKPKTKLEKKHKPGLSSNPNNSLLISLQISLLFMYTPSLKQRRDIKGLYYNMKAETNTT